MPGTASRFIPLKRAAAYPTTTGIRHLAQVLTEPLPSGMLARQTDRLFADLRGPEPGVPDGMKVDVEGNVYCGGAGGLWIIDPHGKKLGRIVHGAPATTNLAFGGDDWKTLYFTSRNHLGAVGVKIAGIPVPTQSGASR